MRKLFNIKRISSMLLAILIIFNITLVLAVEPDVPLSFTYSTDFYAKDAILNSTQKQWKYMYNDSIGENNDGTYSDYTSYVEMTDYENGWHGPSKNGTFTKDRIRGRVATRIAAVWTAPASGKIVIGHSANGIGRVHSNFDPAKDPQDIVIRLVQTDKDKRNPKEIMKKTLEPTPDDNYTKGKHNYNVVVDVTAGDKIFFEAYSRTANYGEYVWNPTIAYNQAYYLYKDDGTLISNMAELAPNDNINCTLYDKDTLSGSMRACIAVYDSNGSLANAKLSEIFTLAEDRRISLNTAMPQYNTNRNEENFNGWSSSITIVEFDTLYPIIALGSFCE